jgi:hypothetical protein
VLNVFNEAVYGSETDRKVTNGAKNIDAAVVDAVKRINDFNRLS